MVSQINEVELAQCMPPLMRFASALTRDPDRAADLVQDSVERALRKAHLFDGANLQGWLNTICKRIFLNNVRRDKIRGMRVALEDAPPARISVCQHQEDELLFKDIVGAFENLKLQDKTILSLVVMEGLKYHEASRVLSIPVGTVRSRLSRARARLAQMVEDGRYRN